MIHALEDFAWWCRASVIVVLYLMAVEVTAARFCRDRRMLHRLSSMPVFLAAIVLMVLFNTPVLPGSEEVGLAALTIGIAIPLIHAGAVLRLVGARAALSVGTWCGVWFVRPYGFFPKGAGFDIEDHLARFASGSWLLSGGRDVVFCT